MRLRHALRCQALWAAISVLSCSSSDSSDDEIVAVPFPTTIELGASDLSALDPEIGDGLLRFASAPAVLAQVRPGQVLVGTATPSTPRGLLRVVLSATRDGQSLTLRTAQAPNPRVTWA